jgi:hypothetical protein
LWEVKDLLAHEQKKSKSKLVNIISNEKLNQSS